jgi:hypothetical protein
MTHPVIGDVEAVARGLTKARVEAIMGFGAEELRDYRSMNGSVRLNLFHQDILKLMKWSAADADGRQQPLMGFTPLGLAVREHLLKENT